MSRVKVVGVQLSPTNNKMKNLKKAINLIDEAMRSYNNVDIVCLPELFYKIPFPPETAHKVAESIPNELTRELSKKAKEYGVYIIGGSFFEKREEEYFNTSILFDRNGDLIGSYSKVHLFDALGIKESDTTTGGKNVPVFQLDFGTIGITICYDLRFPELYRTLAIKGVDIIFVPSAFLSSTGHWETLVKAAAVQNLIHVVAINAIGEYEGIFFGGKSMIVDPSGIPLAIAQAREGFICAEIDLDSQKDLRREIPALNNRRPDLYDL